MLENQIVFSLLESNGNILKLKQYSHDRIILQITMLIIFSRLGIKKLDIFSTDLCRGSSEHKNMLLVSCCRSRNMSIIISWNTTSSYPEECASV